MVEEFAPSLKAALALFEKMARVALATIDYTVDGSDEHYATLTKEGTTSAKVVGALTVEGGGAAAKFTEDLDELGVPTMNKNFKTAKAKLESIARVGERLVNAALSVLKPTVRAKVKEKALADYAKLVGGAKDKLVAVVTEIKEVQEKLGGGSGDASGAAEGGGESESAVQAE